MWRGHGAPKRGARWFVALRCYAEECAISLSTKAQAYSWDLAEYKQVEPAHCPTGATSGGTGGERKLLWAYHPHCFIMRTRIVLTDLTWGWVRKAISRRRSDLKRERRKKYQAIWKTASLDQRTTRMARPHWPSGHWPLATGAIIGGAQAATPFFFFTPDAPRGVARSLFESTWPKLLLAHAARLAQIAR